MAFGFHKATTGAVSSRHTTRRFGIIDNTLFTGGGWHYARARERKPRQRPGRCIFGLITVMDWQAGDLIESPEEYNPGDTITWGGRQNAARSNQYERFYPE